MAPPPARRRVVPLKNGEHRYGSRGLSHEGTGGFRRTHRHALFGNVRPGNPEETEHHGVAGVRCAVQERQFVADRSGEDGFEHGAFRLLHQLVPERAGDLVRGVGIEVEFPRQHVSVDGAQGVIDLGYSRVCGPAGWHVLRLKRAAALRFLGARTCSGQAKAGAPVIVRSRTALPSTGFLNLAHSA